MLATSLPRTERAAAVELAEAALRLREGRFQKWLSLTAGIASIMGGLEVGYEHYRAGYGQRVMYTPVILSCILGCVGIAGFFSPRVARKALRPVSIITLANAGLGFYYHVRGIQRKPGGWRLPVVNMIMGPPVFAPLLFGVSAYLGLVASYMKRSDAPDGTVFPLPAAAGHIACRLTRKHEQISWEQDLREGKFQKHMAAAAAAAAFFSGFESLYSHYKNGFKYKSQWTPVVVSPMLMAASIGAMRNRKVAHTWLPAASLLAVLNGVIGFYYHVKGILRRPGGTKTWFYNLVYGPPIFAPLLFSASGFLGLLSCLLGREDEE